MKINIAHIKTSETLHTFLLFSNGIRKCTKEVKLRPEYLETQFGIFWYIDGKYLPIDEIKINIKK